MLFVNDPYVVRFVLLDIPTRAQNIFPCIFYTIIYEWTNEFKLITQLQNCFFFLHLLPLLSGTGLSAMAWFSVITSFLNLSCMFSCLMTNRDC